MPNRVGQLAETNFISDRFSIINLQNFIHSVLNNQAA
jgi:hypothetical protein